jgi:hypothetical protein
MKSKFESPTLAKFEAFKVHNTRGIFGGFKKEDCPVPNGGCSCDTGAGSVINQLTGTASFSYTSDNQTYNSDGSTGTKDFDGVTGND